MTITEAKRELESCLLIMKQHYKVTWAENGFEALYFLVRLAKAGRKAKAEKRG